jgi:chaperonin GroEL
LKRRSRKLWSAELENVKLKDPEEQVGVNIVKRALEEPMCQIANNAGHEGPIVVGKVKASEDVKFGFNTETEE